MHEARRIAILDPFAGISGDMLLGALVDAGVHPSWLDTLPRRLGFPDVGVDVRPVSRCGVHATKVDFRILEGRSGLGHHGAQVGQLVDIVRRGQVAEEVKGLAVRAFELIGAAEGRVHGVAPDRVHLHEVGAVDAVLDIVGACEGFAHLGAGAVYNHPVAIGSGWVEAAHGHLPVPAPATAILLEGVELARGGPVDGEATTPTGAALLRVLSQGPPPERWRLVASGWGAGMRDPKPYPNALRLLVADVAAEAADVEVIATDLDDLQPEYLEPLREALFGAGALDCLVWATQGKKGRVALRLEALAPPAAAEAVIQALFAHSTTAGLRRWRVARHTLARREVAVELGPDVRVRVKVTEAPDGARVKPEYQDVVQAAARLKRSALSVAREATRLAEAALENGSGT
ncbi:MAG TPA: nickel pincer cofactor biosynthesis protein LarC [Gemmatimonadales bacterium]|nr:nickel pincer cofactor biosynthesis protein LarC [Gemmatimonadales bacterium]